MACAPSLPLPKPSAHAQEISLDRETVKISAFVERYYSQVRDRVNDEDTYICDFCFGNPQQMASPELVKIFVNAVIPDTPEYYAYRTSFDGPRAQLAESAAKRYGFDELDPEDVFFTSGNFAGLLVALQLVVEPEDNVVHMEPGWFFYRRLILNSRCTPKSVKMPLDGLGDGDTGDMRVLLDAIDDKTKVVILNTPHNPSGKVYSKGWLTQFAESLMEMSIRRGYPIYVLSDEAYSDFVFDDGRHDSIAGIYPYTILAYTYNKMTLAPSQRVGYVILSPLMPNREVMRSAVMTLQMTLTWCFPNADMMESIPSLERIRDRFDTSVIARRRDRMCEILEKLGYKVFLKPKGAFYLLVKCPIEDDVRFADVLGRSNVFVLPGDFFNTAGWFRICLTATDEMIERSADGFREAFEEVVEDCV